MTARGAVPVARVEMNWLVVRTAPETSSLVHGLIFQTPTFPALVTTRVSCGTVLDPDAPVTQKLIRFPQRVTRLNPSYVPAFDIPII